MNYTITLSNAEDLALSYVALNQQEWINNAVHERCRIAMDEIMQFTIQKCFETNTQIPNSKDEIVVLAFNQGWLLPASQLTNENNI